jgi:hypothetical protein
MELIETASPELTRRLESLKAEIVQDQSVGATDENKVREFRDLTTDGAWPLEVHML